MAPDGPEVVSVGIGYHSDFVGSYLAKAEGGYLHSTALRVEQLKQRQDNLISMRAGLASQS